MFCTFCKIARIENEAPCPHCGAPSPLLGKARNEARGATASGAPWGASSAQWGAQGTASNTSWEAQAPQLSFESSVPTNPAPAPLPAWTQAAWPPSTGSLGNLPGQEPVQQAEQKAFLPVPYQNPTPWQQEGRQSTLSLQLIPDQTLAQLMPSLPATPETIQVNPIYTKPRPIIPKYRIISGLLSVLIVGLLLCGGAGYYAKTSGKLDAVGQAIGLIPPPNIQPAQTKNLPDPPPQTMKDYGPAFNIIPSATTALHVDLVDHIARDGQNIFQPDQSFYVAFSVHPDNDGKVSAKWYTNGTFYATSPSNGQGNLLLKANGPQKAILGPVSYHQLTEGTVELYWNNQLAQRLYFVVR